MSQICTVARGKPLSHRLFIRLHRRTKFPHCLRAPLGLARALSRTARRSFGASLLAVLAPLETLAQSQGGPRVEAVRVLEQPLIDTVPLTGSVTAERRSQLSAQVAGLVDTLAVDTGDRVSEGDVLMNLDDELVAIDRDRARAALAQVAAQSEDSTRRLEEAQALRDGAIAASDIRALEAEQRGQTAARDAAAAELRRLEAELERHQLTAPYDGVVSSRQIDIGEWVTPGDPLLELVASESLRIHFQVPQRYFPQIAESAEVALRFDAYPNDAYVGQIHRKVPLSEPGSRTFLLRVNPPKESPLLIPGMATSGELRLDTERTGLAVPRDALIRYPDGRITVWVAQSGSEGAESNVTEQRVTTGMSADGWVEIRSGLSDGDVVITRGNEALREGQTVMVERVSARESRDGAG